MQLRGELGQIAKFKELRDGAKIDHAQQDVASEPRSVRRCARLPRMQIYPVYASDMPGDCTHSKARCRQRTESL